MRILWILLAPLRLLWRLILRPLRLRARRRVLKKDGWVELHLEGAVMEVRAAPRLPPFVLRFLRREDAPRVVLSRLRKLADELIADPNAKALLVQIGSIGGGWAAALEIRTQLDRIRAANKQILVHIAGYAGNRETLIAGAGHRVLITHSGALDATGSAASTVFVKETLDKIGVGVEVAWRGRYKSAPDQLTHQERTAPDLEQVKALVDEIDEELAQSVMRGRNVTRERAVEMIDQAPLLGPETVAGGWCDGLAHDEDLPEEAQKMAGTEKPPLLVGAGNYLEVRAIPPLIRRRKKLVGIVEVHGAIVDRGSPYAPYFGKLAVERAVVNDLRAALEEPEIGAVVLHVDSRGGSAPASDVIHAAVKRLNQEKPVIACFADVAASGGYYVACPARAIVCSPLTITGSIGVYTIIPTWPELAKRLNVNHDVVKNRKHAGMFDPWNGFSDETRAHLDRRVGTMYETFLSVVAEGRKKSRDEVALIAEGRVWSGRAALGVGLVDSLGGFQEAIARAKEAATGVKFADEPVLVRSRQYHPRPDPYRDEEKKDEKRGSLGLVTELLGHAPGGTIARELALLALTSARGPVPLLAYAPFELR